MRNTHQETYLECLTEQERAVFDLICAGLENNRLIGRRLKLSYAAVACAKSAILRKTDASTFAQLAFSVGEMRHGGFPSWHWTNQPDAA